MRISELASVSGVPVATIKFYLREGVLHPGQKLTPRLTEYDDSHRLRLGLIRVLREVGDVPVDRLGQLVNTAQSPHATVHEMLAAAATALAPEPAPVTEQRSHVRALADGIIAQAGWTNVRPDSIGRDHLASVLEAILRYQTHEADPAGVLPYVRAADEIARYEIWQLDGTGDRVELLEEMVVGQVVFGELLANLRWLAQEHYSAVRFGAVTDPAEASIEPPAADPRG
ncbi:MerR family transcriptional regulator [Nocardioides sp.]|uniref:MerR family transcriptional regulator n=1 Tax=Nocardioides sp. TaxID=35761 RepID=UPI003D0B66D3